MLDALFGTELPLPVKFFIAFVAILVLMGGAVYAVRRFGATALGAAAAARGRQPRLAVIDAAPVDARRRLVLIRRDNVEHLIMIGGPTDVVVEPNILRAIPTTAAARDTAPPRVTTDTLPRAVPLAEGGTWPLQPEPAPRPQRAPPPEPVHEVANWPAQPEPAPRAAPESAPRMQNPDRLAGLAADLSRTFHEPEVAPPPRRSAEPRRTAPAQPITDSEDQNLAEMAHRLESALHRPRQGGEPAIDEVATREEDALYAEPKPVRTEPKSVRVEPVRAEPVRAEPKPVRAEPKPARADAKPAPKPVFDNLEQEMASLLGRPAGKT